MKDVNPVTVLKTAIQLHQRQPRRERHLGASSAATVTTFSPTAQAHPSPSPVVPTQQHFTQKLENLKKVLPFANEVKLASLLARAQGDMDAVVQEILDSSMQTPQRNVRSEMCRTTNAESDQWFNLH